jgi:hypothetical protein
MEAHVYRLWPETVYDYVYVAFSSICTGGSCRFETAPHERKRCNSILLPKKGRQERNTEKYNERVYADDVNILYDNIDTIKKNTQTLIDASKEIGLEVNTEKTKYMRKCIICKSA